eukprot:767758-Hanusia_phi.AAC.4
MLMPESPTGSDALAASAAHRGVQPDGQSCIYQTTQYTSPSTCRSPQGVTHPGAGLNWQGCSMIDFMEVLAIFFPLLAVLAAAFTMPAVSCMRMITFFLKESSLNAGRSGGCGMPRSARLSNMLGWRGATKQGCELSKN